MPRVSRRKLLSRLAMGAPAAALLPAIDSVDSIRSIGGLTGRGPSDGPTANVTICHRPRTPEQQTLNVPLVAALLHLLHGDTLGPCPGTTTTAPGSTVPFTTTTAAPGSTMPPVTTKAFPTTTAAS